MWPRVSCYMDCNQPRKNCVTCSTFGCANWLHEKCCKNNRYSDDDFLCPRCEDLEYRCKNCEKVENVIMCHHCEFMLCPGCFGDVFTTGVTDKYWTCARCDEGVSRAKNIKARLLRIRDESPDSSPSNEIPNEAAIEEPSVSNGDPLPSTSQVQDTRSINQIPDVPSTVPEPQNSGLEYQVEAIIAHRIKTNGSRQFKIKWKGYTDYTWEPEENLATCYETLLEYIDRFPLTLERTRIEPVISNLGGSAPSYTYNRDNWVTINHVLSAIDSNKHSKTYAANIGFAVFSQLSNEDKIYVLLYENHFYCFLHVVKLQKCFIADSSNLCATERYQDLSELIGASLTPVPVRAWIKADHCGSDAVMIALKLSVNYKSKVFADPIDLTGDKLLSSIKKVMHKHKSSSMNNVSRCTIGESAHCKICNKPFKYRNMKALKGHVRLCHKMNWLNYDQL